MNKYCMAFNGQGRQDSNSFQNFLRVGTDFREVIQLTNDCLGEDIVQIIESDKLLKNVKYVQISNFFMNHCLYLYCKEKCKISPRTLLGHSLDHYNALVVAGCITYEDALKIVRKRAGLTDYVASQSSGTGMFCIYGPNLDLNRISEICCKISSGDKFVGISIINSPQNVTLSFYNLSFSYISDQFKGYHCLKIDVPAPYHSKAMKPVCDEFEREIEKVKIEDPGMEIISNVTAMPLRKEWIKKDLVRHLSEPINIYGCLQYLKKIGVSGLLEVSLFKVISKIASLNCNIDSYNLMQDMDLFLPEI